MRITFEWTPEISVYDDSLDNEHKKLLEAINSLLGIVTGEEKQETVGNIISFLDAYIEVHFAHEEKYMKEHGYPHLDEHRELHSYFILQYNAFKERLDKRGPVEDLVFDVETYLGNWWLQHIGAEDKKYADFIKERAH